MLKGERSFFKQQTIAKLKIRSFIVTLNKTIKKKFNVILLGSFLTQFRTDKNAEYEFELNFLKFGWGYP
ncbi:hypothetical protein BpHYR1_054671 [Brachionus plicatilis]|uniref:Uncharacterized protein n=1 Tax=Brachionus plicatilis TaxID=10195 RepID=A0A3M7PFB1_BRAPC|nr:hypothetical protein BpHYR1_054671 [Brachionus plicatilis]